MMTGVPLFMDIPIGNSSGKWKASHFLTVNLAMVFPCPSPSQACRETRFSHGGQFFAAVNSNTIQAWGFHR